MTVEWIKPILLQTGMSNSDAFFTSYAIVIAGILLCSWLANDLTKRYIRFFTRRVLVKAHSKWVKSAIKRRLFYRLSHLAPALVIYAAIPLLKLKTVLFTWHLVKAVETVTVVYMIAVVTFVIRSVLNVIEDLYKSSENAHRRPIKSYIQLTALFIYAIAGILIVATILGKSPLVFLTGLGAMMAVIMVVFKDTIMGLAANIQNVGSDIMHIGDWVEIRQYGVDGEVIEMSLNHIKVQNFDKTIVTIPAQAILAGGIKNWRGMYESGGRRIKRAVNIDMRSVRFCTKAMLSKFKKMSYISEYILENENQLVLTNIRIFREYLKIYLRNHPKIRNDYACLVRYLDPTEKGLPLEIYVFTNDTDWSAYEDIQSDIFDHLLAILPEFELKVFQNSSGNDSSS
jgi:miniconductance mechanosensitive channel